MDGSVRIGPAVYRIGFDKGMMNTHEGRAYHQ